MAYPLLLCGGCNLVTIGWPYPLWYFESLNNPAVVQSVAADRLELADGRRVALPMIASIAHDHPAFRAAIQEGIEIDGEGRVFGLLWIDRICGMDPYVWRKLRVNLSALSAGLHPEGIDASLIPPETVCFIAEHYRVPETASRRANGYTLLTLRQIQRELEESQRNSVEED